MNHITRVLSFLIKLEFNKKPRGSGFGTIIDNSIQFQIGTDVQDNTVVEIIRSRIKYILNNVTAADQ